MDGNGRWARKRGFLRLRGHERGAESLRRITRYCARIGVSELTFYALSTENYTRRPDREVGFLMKLLKDFLIGERQELEDGNIQLRSIGRTEDLPDDVQTELEITRKGSEDHTGMVLRLALNYGGRREILDAIQKCAESHSNSASGGLDQALANLDEKSIRKYFYDPDMSDPDLVIRTAGEARLSNFLLWQASYAEIWTTQTLWPDFQVDHLVEALKDYARRVRKFGAIDPLDRETEETPTPTQ